MTAKVQPQWIAKMYPSKVGRDHLGLGSVSSDQILPSLSPSINVLTHHPRYHSFYVFLLDEYWQRDRPRSRKAWKEFFRPREFIFSVGANLCDQSEHGVMGNIVGSNTTAPLANQQINKYDTTTHYIESDLGGYGLYYRSVMIELGLVYPGGQGLPYPVDLPSEKGKEVASAFREAVKNTAYYRRYFDKDVAQVPIEMIREYIRQACLCQLQTSRASDRALLLDLFMRHGNGGLQFIGREWSHFIQATGTTDVRTHPYHPQSNGRDERVHRTFREEMPLDENALLYEARHVIADYGAYYNHR